MRVVELTRPPSLPALYAKAAAGMATGLAGRLPPRLAERLPRRRRARPGAELPDTELVLRRVPVDRSRLAEYARVCGFRLTDTLPATYPHVLAFPLTLMLMTQPAFPLPVVGVVHIANRVEQRRPLDAAEPLDLAVHAENLRPHPRGRQLDVVAVASVAGVEVWRGVATYLHRSESGAGERAAPPAPPTPPAPTAVWRVGAEIGPAYAAVSGDRNPIHLSDLAARGFGFRRRIAHGMWTKARCLAQLAARLPQGYAVDVTFRAPVLLPGTVGFSASESGTGWEFALHDANSGKPHLSGTIAALPEPVA